MNVLNFSSIRSFAASGNLGMLKKHKNFSITDICNIAEAAAFNGHLAVVKWVVEKKEYRNLDEIAYSAASGGRFKIVKWAIENGAENYGMVALGAASGGYIKILNWAMKNGEVNFDAIAAMATEMQRMDLVRLAIECGARKLSQCIRNAHTAGNISELLNLFKTLMIEGDENVYKWLKSRTNPYLQDIGIYDFMLKIEAVRRMYGCVDTTDVAEEALEKGAKVVVQKYQAGQATPDEFIKELTARRHLTLVYERKD